MMYSEFVKGTGCRENDHNYKVYKDLEVMYMNSDLTKEQIYEYGKKLVDNSKSPEQVALEEQLKAEIAELKQEIKFWQDKIDAYKMFFEMDGDPSWKKSIKSYREHVKALKMRISGLKFVLAA